MTRFATASLALLFFGIDQCHGQWKSSLNLRHVTSRYVREDDIDEINRLLREEDERHPDTVLENDYPTIPNHPNPVTLRNSYFLTKYCAPDVNGYYGSTAGTPLEINFAFEAETAPGADVDRVVEAIHESVETALLTTFFPTMCHKGAVPYDSHVTGFHFDPTSVKYEGSCQALQDDKNTCGVYMGKLRVYGEGGDALAVIRDHLDRDETVTIHQHLRRLFSVGVNTGIISVEPEEESSASIGMPSSAVAGLAVALLTLSVGILGLFAVQVRRRRRKSKATAQEGSTSEAESDENDSHETVDFEEGALVVLEENESQETVDFEEGTLVVIEGGRPNTYVIDFDGLRSLDSELL